MGVDYSVWVHVGQLDGLPDLALQALGSGPCDGELDGVRVPAVLQGRTAQRISELLLLYGEHPWGMEVNLN